MVGLILVLVGLWAVFGDVILTLVLLALGFKGAKYLIKWFKGTFR